MNFHLPQNKILIAPIAFNEGSKLEKTLHRLLQFPHGDKILINDGSTDGTKEIGEKLDVPTISHKQRQGVGAGIRTVIQYALKHDYEILVIMAGNDKDRPNEIPRLIDPILMNQADIVQGSRYLPGGQYRDIPFYRIFATKFLHPLLFRIFSGKQLTDTTNGFRAIRLSIFRNPKINLNQAWLDSYGLEPYILFQASKLGYTLTEVPVCKIYPKNQKSYTKMIPILDWWRIVRPLIYLGLKFRK